MAAAVRKAQVEQDQVRRILANLLESRFGGADLLDGVPGGRQELAQDVADLLVVVDDERFGVRWDLTGWGNGCLSPLGIAAMSVTDEPGRVTARDPGPRPARSAG